MRTRILGIAVVLAAILASASSASALTRAYASASSPQSMSGYGSSASTYGTWFITKRDSSSIASSLSAASYRYTDADNHTVYVDLNSYAYRAANSTFANLSKQSSHDNIVSGAWSAFRSRPSVVLSIMTSGTISVSGGIKTCLDVPLRTDPCSAVTVLDGNL